jgi:hypothetical protein
MSIPFDMLADTWMGIISITLFVGIIGIMCGVEALLDKWRS